ncbi:MAG: acyl-CoA dehydrogenase family protein [Gammaproteobacteria bacterium]
MDFLLTEEQKMIQDGVRRFREDEYGFDARRKLLETPEGRSAAHWRTFAELGWLSIGLPEDVGGLGGTIVETGVVMEEFGRALLVEPYLNCAVLAGQIIDATGSPAQREALLGAIGAGEITIAVAHAEPQARGVIEDIHTRAERQADGSYRLHGGKCVVAGAPLADRLLVPARVSGAERDRDGIGLFLVGREQDGVALQSYRTIDGLRAADVTLAGARVGAEDVLGTPGDAWPALDRAIAYAITAACAEALGAMDQALWITRDYLKTRKQFGVTLNTFQALQHRMADMLIEVEQSRSILYRAYEAMGYADADARRKGVSAAKAHIGRSGRFVCGHAIQLHGGIGVTEEHSIGHYYKRLMAFENQFGNTDFHLQRFAGL